MITAIAIIIKRCLYNFKHCLNGMSIGSFLQWDKRLNGGPTRAPVNVLLFPGAANRDPRRWLNADIYDIDFCFSRLCVVSARPSPPRFGDLARSFSDTFSTHE